MLTFVPHVKPGLDVAPTGPTFSLASPRASCSDQPFGVWVLLFSRIAWGDFIEVSVLNMLPSCNIHDHP